MFKWHLDTMDKIEWRRFCRRKKSRPAEVCRAEYEGDDAIAYSWTMFIYIKKKNRSLPCIYLSLIS